VSYSELPRIKFTRAHLFSLVVSEGDDLSSEEDEGVLSSLCCSPHPDYLNPDMLVSSEAEGLLYLIVYRCNLSDILVQTILRTSISFPGSNPSHARRQMTRVRAFFSIAASTNISG
jgi:hypothetical protein